MVPFPRYPPRSARQPMIRYGGISIGQTAPPRGPTRADDVHVDIGPAVIEDPVPPTFVQQLPKMLLLGVVTGAAFAIGSGLVHRYLLPSR